MYQLWLLTSIISSMVYKGYPDLRDEPLQALFLSFFHTHIHVLSSFWKSRGHRWSSLPPPRFLPSIFIAQRVQQSHCSSIFRRVLLTHALAPSASQFVHKKKSPRMYTSMHSGGFELTKLTCTRLEDILIRHRGDRNISLTDKHRSYNDLYK